MTTKKKLRKQIGKLEEELRETVRQARYAENVCYWVGQTLEPKNEYVLRNRKERLEKAYARWKKEVPYLPWRGVCVDFDTPEVGEWLVIEWQDTDGYWHFLDRAREGLDVRTDE